MDAKHLYRQAVAFLLATALLLSLVTADASSYATLEFGSKGAEVLQLQKALLTLGYDPNGTDGKFGRGTETAVKLYQAAKGLTADGKAGSKTLTQLYAELGTASTDGTVASDSTTSGTTSGTTYNPNTLKYGDSGDKVTALQTALKQLGYDPNGVDGRFGAGTQRAVISFQKANSLTADGLAGTKTQNLLYSLASSAAGSAAGSTSGSTSSGSSSSASSGSTAYTRTLRKGYTGSDVIAVQTQLAALGYYAYSVDGVYGTGSIAAVKKFQQANGLTADGLAGSRTFTVLFSSSAVAAGSSSSSSSGSSSGSGSSGSTDNASGGSSSGSDASSTYITLSYGSNGTAVKNLQQALKNLNYNVGVDGDYGALTQTAVAAFQKQNGLTADGVAGAKTQEVLFSGSAKQADPDANADMIITDDTGKASGPSTSQVQLLHWFNDVKPTLKSGNKLTIFDPATNLQWTLRVYSCGRHCDSEPLTLTDTQIMYKAFGNTNTWTPKPVYVQLPSGAWSLASMHNVPHLSGGITDNGFDGHLCVHFLRDMDECRQNDPNYGVTNQNTIRKKWKEMTGITVE